MRRSRNTDGSVSVTIVVAIGQNGVIGRDGDLPWPPTGDLAQFKALTMGHPMIMGRTTYESIGRPLPGRTSIVLSRDPAWAAEGVEAAVDLPAALTRAAELDDEVFLIGGAQVYAAALEAGSVDRMVVTHVQLSPEGDAFFPEIDDETWRETARDSYDSYDIATYVRA